MAGGTCEHSASCAYVACTLVVFFFFSYPSYHLKEMLSARNPFVQSANSSHLSLLRSIPLFSCESLHSYYDLDNRRANNGSLYSPGVRPVADPLASLPSKSWQETMVGQCKSALAVRPKKAHAVLFYSQVTNSPAYLAFPFCPLVEVYFCLACNPFYQPTLALCFRACLLPLDAAARRILGPDEQARWVSGRRWREMGS